MSQYSGFLQYTFYRKASLNCDPPRKAVPILTELRPDNKTGPESGTRVSKYSDTENADFLKRLSEIRKSETFQQYLNCFASIIHLLNTV